MIWCPIKIDSVTLYHENSNSSIEDYFLCLTVKKMENLPAASP